MIKEAKNFIEEYEYLAKLHYKCLLNGDSKTGNKSYHKLTKLFKILQSDKQLSEEVLPILLNDSNYSVQGWAAAHCLGLGINLDEAVQKLEQISKLDRRDILSYNAEKHLRFGENKVH